MASDGYGIETYGVGGVGVTIGVVVEVDVDADVNGAAPTGTIGVGVVEVLVESLCPDDDLACGGGRPSGTTMGVAAPASLPPVSESELKSGGQSTDVGGQLSVLPDPLPGAAHPAAAPKSPAPVQLSAPAGAAVVIVVTVAQDTSAVARNRRCLAVIARGCPRTR
jgi:hypothetical protein